MCAGGVTPSLAGGLLQGKRLVACALFLHLCIACFGIWLATPCQAAPVPPGPAWRLAAGPLGPWPVAGGWEAQLSH